MGIKFEALSSDDPTRGKTCHLGGYDLMVMVLEYASLYKTTISK